MHVCGHNVQVVEGNGDKLFKVAYKGTTRSNRMIFLKSNGREEYQDIY